MVQLSCRIMHDNFNPFSYARRTCLSDGVWGSVDVSGCTIPSQKTPAIAIVVVANVTASRMEVADNRSILVKQVRNPLCLTQLLVHNVVLLYFVHFPTFIYTMQALHQLNTIFTYYLV